MRSDYEKINVDVKEEIAIITMNNPPVNQLSPQFAEELRDAITEALEEKKIKAVILTGSGKNFIAGADITQLYAATDQEKIREVAVGMARFLDGIEMAPKPFIAAINGNALGGGLEIAMACHYRISVKGASLGNPRFR